MPYEINDTKSTQQYNRIFLNMYQQKKKKIILGCYRSLIGTELHRTRPGDQPMRGPQFVMGPHDHLGIFF